jgi:hypothetical protein
MWVLWNHKLSNFSTIAMVSSTKTNYLHMLRIFSLPDMKSKGWKSYQNVLIRVIMIYFATFILFVIIVMKSFLILLDIKVIILREISSSYHDINIVCTCACTRTCLYICLWTQYFFLYYKLFAKIKISELSYSLLQVK